MGKILFLSSLLHDIRKLWQRTGNQDISKILKKEYKDIYKGENAKSPRHQEWGAYFCENYIKIPEVTLTVRNHHKPSNALEHIVQAGDRLSSGERAES